MERERKALMAAAVAIAGEEGLAENGDGGKPYEAFERRGEWACGRSTHPHR